MSSSASTGSVNITLSGNWNLVEAVNSSGTSNVTTVYNCGTSNASNTTTLTPVPSTITGTLYVNGRGGTATNSVAGKFGELLVFSNALTDTQRKSVEGYLAWKWGLQTQQASSPPTSISGCALWLDAADSTTITLSGANVAQINDKSGNGRNLPAVSGFANATVSSAFQNGLNVLNFSGNGLYRTAANSAVYPQDAYVIVALKSLTAQVDVLGMGSTSSDSFNSLTFSEYTTSRWHNGSTNFNRTPNCVSPTNETSTGFLLIQWSIANNNFLLRRNGILLVQTASYTYTIPSDFVFQIGYRLPSVAQANLSAYIGEVIVFSNALSDNQRQSVENYLSKKWSITISSSLPAIHPFYSLPAFSRPFGPLDIPGCALWLDAADQSSMTFSSGNNVNLWKDKSGNNNNASQSTTANQPSTYTSANGLTGMNFSLSNYFRGSFSSPITGNTLSAFVILNMNSSTYNYGRALSLSTSNNNDYISGAGGTNISRNSSNVALWQEAFGNGAATVGPFSINTSTTYLVDSMFDGTTHTGYLNGTSVGSAAISSNFSIYLFGIGFQAYQLVASTNDYWVGYINEVIVYSNALSTTQRQQVEGYLAAKWGLLNDLPGKVITPPAISGCALWLDGADSGSMTFSTGTSNITQWRDKSGLGNHASPRNGSPVFTSNSINGVASIYLSNAPSFSGSVSITGTTYTAFAVAVTPSIPNTLGHDQRLLSFAVNSTGADYNLVTSSIGFFNWQQGTDGSGAKIITMRNNTTVGCNVISANVPFMGSALYNGANGYLWSNGTAATTTGAASSGNFAISVYGVGDHASNSPGEYWNGYIGEIIVFSNALTDSQRQQIEGYLASKWKITYTAPTLHPFKSIPPSTSQPPQFQEVTPGNWKYDWQPYLSNLTAANSGATASIGTSITPSVKCGFAATLAPNGNLYSYGWDVTGITVVNTTTNTIVTTITGTTTYAYFSSCLGPDGNIYCSPYCAATVCVIYPATNTFSTSAITMLSTPNSTPPNGSYCGSVLGPNGKIYCIPRAYAISCSIGIIDTVAKTFNIMPSAVVTANQGYIGGVLAPNGKIYCIPFVDSGSVSVGIIDPATDTFTTMPSSSVSTVGAYNGGVLAPNGKIYCIPYNATNVGIIDPVANTFNTTTITNAPGSAAYTGGCLGPNGKIYFAPRSRTAFGVVDPVANTLTTTGGVSGTSGSGYSGAFLTPGGKFYCPNVDSAVVNVVNFSSLSQTPSLNYCLSSYTNKS